MITVQGYYNTLYENFVKPRMQLFESSLSYHFDDNEQLFRGSSGLIALLDAVYKKYDFNLHQQIKPVMQHFCLYQLQICNDIDTERLETALLFVLFCCLGDKFLDSPRFTNEDKECICQKLNTDYMSCEKPYESTSFQEMDVFINQIRTFIVRQPDTPGMQSLLKEIQDAFDSEIYMSKTRMPMSELFRKEDLHLLTDKSVKFERAAFFLSVFGNVTPEAEIIADSIAKIFWLVDDLCDFVEDVQCKRRNSLLFLYTEESNEMALSERIDRVCKELPRIYTLLDEEIERLRMYADPQLYHVIITQIWDWFSNVRQKADDRTQA